MKFILSLLAAAFILTGCGGEPPADVRTPQDALVGLSADAGYTIDGEPYYVGRRWMANVRVPGCPAEVTVASPEAPRTAIPLFFTVFAVDGVSLAGTNQDANFSNLSARDLSGLEGMKARLRCP